MSFRLRGGGAAGIAVFPPASPSAGLSEFLAKLRQREKPRLYDVGPAPGGNIVFFAEQGLRVYVDADRDHRLAGSAPDIGHFEEGELDAALLWDLLDFLPTDRAMPFVRQLERAVKPGGLVFLLSSAIKSSDPGPVFSYVVERGAPEPAAVRRGPSSPQPLRSGASPPPHLAARPIDGALARRVPRENRDLLRLFGQFENIALHLLRSQMREMVLRRR